MEEKTLLKFKSRKAFSKIVTVWTILLAVLWIYVSLVAPAIDAYNYYNWHISDECSSSYCDVHNQSFINYMLDELFGPGASDEIWLGILVFGMQILVLNIVKKSLTYDITATNLRLYGKRGYRAFQLDYKNVIAACEKGKHGVNITTADGIVSFRYVENREELIGILNQYKPEVAEREFTPTNFDAHIRPYRYGLVKLVFLSIITFGIWQLVWLYRMTKCLNFARLADDRIAYRRPGRKLLMCIFFPTYTVWWFYKSSEALKAMEKAKSLKSEAGILCPIFAVILPVVAMLMLQDRINTLIEN